MQKSQPADVGEKAGTEEGKPKGVSSDKWQKFKELQLKRKRLTDAQKDETSLETDPLKDTDDVLTKGTLDRPELKGASPTASSAKRPSKDDEGTDEPHNKVSRSSGDGDVSAPSCSTQDWLSVRKYIGINDHLKGVDRGKAGAKTELEKKIDSAISRGDFEAAEKLSDDMATREFGKNIADAFDARKFEEKRQKEKQLLEAKKKKKLNWGFSQKERWETKSNM